MMALDHRSAATHAEEEIARKGAVALTAGLYFLTVFAVGLLFGPIRVVYLEPWLGPTFAVLIESPFLLAAMAFAARWTPVWTNLTPTTTALLAMGLLALVFQQIADLAVGFGLRGMTLSQQLALFATPPGWIYLFDLVAFALAPLIARRRPS